MKEWKPEPPPLGDKLADWQALGDAGGDALIIDRDVLDIGPFWGIDAALYATRARSYTAIDSAEQVLEQVHRIAPTVRLVLADLCQPWPFEAASFDTVIDFSTLDDIERPELGYKEAARVLRPGGTLLSCFANARAIDVPVPYTTQDPQGLQSYLTTLGFKVRHLGRREQPRAVIVAIRNGEPGAAPPRPYEAIERIRDLAVFATKRRHDADTAHDLREIESLAEAALVVLNKDPRS